MKRLLCFAVLMGLTTSAQAGSFSFVLAGHRIRIAAPRHCYAASCLSVSIPGLSQTHRNRGDDSDALKDAAPATRAAAPAVAAPVVAAPAPPPPIPQVAAATMPAAETRALVPPPSPAPSPPSPAPQLAATVSKPAAPPPPPSEPIKTASTEKPILEQPPVDKQPADKQPVDKQPVDKQPADKQPVDKQPVDKQPADKQSAETPPVAAKPAPIAPAPAEISPAKILQAKTSQPTEAARANTPIGDWQTEGKTGSVRIEYCGKALCGYLINASTSAKGEAILINMKPNSATEWRGSIFSRASGNTYNAAMTLKRPDLLRVEACAFARFFCSGNDWTRMVMPEELITSREPAPKPRS